MNSDGDDINDTTKVKALLEQLRSSGAWQAAITHPVQSNQPVAGPSQVPLSAAHGQELVSSHSSSSPPASSVASLLSQLAPPEGQRVPASAPSSGPSTSLDVSYDLIDDRTTWGAHTAHVTVPTSSQGDIKSLTFQQTLPILTKLGGDPAFISTLKRLKEKQNELERCLWDERQAIETKYRDKVTVAQKKAELIGGGITKHDSEVLNNNYRKELQRFDAERVVNAWDSLITEQQCTLEAAGVPTMFATKLKTEIEKQKKVMQVLDALIA